VNLSTGFRTLFTSGVGAKEACAFDLLIEGVLREAVIKEDVLKEGFFEEGVFKALSIRVIIPNLASGSRNEGTFLVIVPFTFVATT
jgi:hypothetical protein